MYNQDPILPLHFKVSVGSTQPTFHVPANQMLNHGENTTALLIGVQKDVVCEMF